MVGVIIMGMGLVKAAGTFIEALMLGDVGGVFVAQPPFPDEPCQVSCPLEHLSYGEVLRSQRPVTIAANKGVSGMQARHQATARRGADGASSVEIPKANALRGEFIDVGSLNLCL